MRPRVLDRTFVGSIRNPASLTRATAGLYPVWIMLAFAAAIFLRLYRLTAQPLWLDELYTAQLVKAGLATIWRIAFVDVLPPLSSLPFWIGAQIGGQSAAGLRMTSAAAALISVWAFYKYSKTLLDRPAALGALCLFAVSPLAIYYAQEARPYALALMGAVLTSWAIERVFTRGDRGSWAIYAAVAAVAAQFHYFNAALVGAQLLALVLIRRDRRSLLGAGAVFLLVTTSLGIFLVGALSVVRGWRSGGGLSFLPAMQTLLAGDNRFAPQLVRSLTLILTAGGLLAALTARRYRLLLLHGLQILLPCLVAFVFLPLVHRPAPAYDERTFLMILPSVVLLVGVGVESIMRQTSWVRFLGPALVVVLCLLSAVSLAHYFADFNKSPEGHLAKTVIAQAQPGDTVITQPDAYSVEAALQFYGTDLRVYRYGGEDTRGQYIISNPSVLLLSTSRSTKIPLEQFLSQDRLWLVQRSVRPAYTDRLTFSFATSGEYSAGPFRAWLLTRR